jgi:hemerythrin-like domain-containing protein
MTPNEKMDLIEKLKKEHRQLMALVVEMEVAVMGIEDPVPPHVREKLRETVQRFFEQLTSHDELERRELFPVLRKHIQEADQWQAGMIEIQDEMILTEARHFLELVSKESSSVSADRVLEGSSHLIRWVREHVMIEEQVLFPRLEGTP